MKRQVSPFLQSPLKSQPPPLQRPLPSAAAWSTPTGADNEQLSFVEKLYDMLGLMRGNEYTPYVRGLFTAVVPSALLYLLVPSVFYEPGSDEFRWSALAIPAVLFVYGAFFV